jgi:hypothetical protein
LAQSAAASLAAARSASSSSAAAEGASTASGSAKQPAAVAGQTSAAKPVAKAAAPHAPVTEAEKQQAKLKREQANDAFHGRLAGIKHNVDALNNRLTDFEDKVHKEDAKLEKGDPDNFKIDLD